jgi:integrase
MSVRSISPYVVRTVILSSGERLPYLCSRQSGLPLFEPTLYALTELRARSRATATIQQALRAVMLLFMAMDRLGVDIDVRLAEGRLLELGELDELVRTCRLKLGDESERRRPREGSEVDRATAAVRIQYISDYLGWLATDRLLKAGPRSPRHMSLKTTADTVQSALRERVPSSSARNTQRRRAGLSAAVRARLVGVIEPTSADNPWVGGHARERNRLIVRWLLALGLRRGELLGVRISDINFQTTEVLIARRADDPADPRRAQPNTKTRDRLLFLDEDLELLTRQYIIGPRRALPGARKHEYLFVANGSGAPLTLAALNKVFAALRRRCPDIPNDLTPHVLRHTWNDLFSEVMDKQKVPEEIEKRSRARIMGWSPTSKMPATYTRRHVEQKAREASLQLQRRLAKGGDLAD